MRLLMLGDIFGEPGRAMIMRWVKLLRQAWRIDTVIANGENASGGAGLSPRHAKRLVQGGIDVITMGNHLFNRKDWRELVTAYPVTRPHNLGGDELAGSGVHWFPSRKNPKLVVLNLEGRVFLDRAECPFYWVDRLLSGITDDLPVVLDFHAEATSEKQALAWHLVGRAALMVGTHTHIQTSDAGILPQTTMGYVTDLGMTGPATGVLGVDRMVVLDRFRMGVSAEFQVAGGPTHMEGIVADVGPGRTTNRIRSFRLLDTGKIHWTGATSAEFAELPTDIASTASSGA